MDLIDRMRRESDGRYIRQAKEFDLGLVTSMNPLQIQPRALTTTPVILNADDVLVIPGVPIEQGMTVALVRTRNNETIAFPIIIGKDIAPPPSFSGTPAGVGTDPNSTVVLAEPSVGGPAGERVIAQALYYASIGVKENPAGSNGDGGKINEWQDAWGMGRGPWCGAFADAMFREAGVNDDGIGNPSTLTIYNTAKAAGQVYDRPIKGCFAVKTPGAHGHVTLYIDGPLEAANCVGGNQGDAVTKRVYDIRGWYYCIPDALKVNANS
jgi:hypothetical protein